MTIHQTAVSLHLDTLPPSTNHIYKSIGGARKALTDKVKTFRQLVALSVRGLLMVNDGDLCCTVVLTFGTKHRQDADNRIKSLSDALALALGFDDSRITEWHIIAERGTTSGVDLTLEVRDEE